jgi:cation-transporting ATPase 13A2
MLPKNSYKITEDLIFKKGSHSLYGKRYKLTIVKRFDFSSKFQSNSVIVRNNLDGSYRFFIKGAPEKIMQICDPQTLPEKFNEDLLSQTQNGYRVLACASKPLENFVESELEKDRDKYEQGLIFLGFIIFKNKLKRDTKHIIGKLKDSNCKLLIATGDNPFTTISVARECELVDEKQDIYFCNLEKDFLEGVEKLKWYNVKISHEHKKISNDKIFSKKRSFLNFEPQSARSGT